MRGRGAGLVARLARLLIAALDGLWRAFGLELLGLVALNLLAAAILGINRLRKGSAAQQDMVARYFQAEGKLRLMWEPYVYWRTHPMIGDCVNVDADGLRKTWGAGKRTVKPGAKVFVFGGSTVFGHGTCDDFTIPSELAKALNAAGMRNVEVVNFGQLGYVSTQEVLSLLWSLRLGNVPEVAVFCDGFNDVVSAYQNGVAGITENEENRVAEFNALNVTMDPLGAAGRTVVAAMRSLSVIHLSRRVLRRIGIPVPERGSRGIRMSWDVSYAGERDPRLARQVVASYAANARLVEGVSRSLGFTALFYWQPTVYEDKDMAVQLPRGAGTTAQFQNFLRESYAAAAALSRKPDDAGFTLTDLGAALNGQPEGCFLDDVHLDQRCNEVVARIIAPDVIRALRHGSEPAKPSGRASRAH